MKMWIVAFLCVVVTSQARGQAVDVISYSKRVDDKIVGGLRFVNPLGPYPDNDTISLKALTLDKGRHTVFAAATLTSEVAPSKVIFVFQRIVDSGDSRCVAESDQDFKASGDLKEIKSPDSNDEKLSKVRILYRWISDLVGSDELGVGTVKVKLVTTEPGQRTYYDYRYV